MCKSILVNLFMVLLLVAGIAHATPPTSHESFPFINLARAEAGLLPVAYSEGLSRAALLYAEQVALTGSYGPNDLHSATSGNVRRAFFHESMSQERHLDALTKHEIVLVQFEYDVDARSTVMLFETSESHWVMIVGAQFTHMGISTYEGYGVSVTIIYGVEQ